MSPFQFASHFREAPRATEATLPLSIIASTLVQQNSTGLRRVRPFTVFTMHRNDGAFVREDDCSHLPRTVITVAKGAPRAPISFTCLGISETLTRLLSVLPSCAAKNTEPPIVSNTMVKAERLRLFMRLSLLAVMVASDLNRDACKLRFVREKNCRDVSWLFRRYGVGICSSWPARKRTASRV